MQYVEIKRTEHEMQIMQRERASLFYSQNITSLHDYQTWWTCYFFFRKHYFFLGIHEVCKGMKASFLVVPFGCWLAGQSESDHMDVSMALLIYKANMWALITSNMWYTSNGQGKNKFLLVHPLRTQEQHGHVYALSCFWWQSAWYKHFPGN